MSALYIGILFNLVMALFNVVGALTLPRARFFDWYLDGGMWWIMGSVWAVLLVFMLAGF